MFVLLESVWHLLQNSYDITHPTNFRCHRLMTKVNKSKNSDMENFIWNQYGERPAILITKISKFVENNKVRGD